MNEWEQASNEKSTTIRGPSRIGTKFYAKLYLVFIQLDTDTFFDETPDCCRFSC